MTTVQPYPFYDELELKVNQNRNRTIEVRSISAIINEIDRKLPQDQANMIYEEIAALIYHHELKNKNGISWGSPFYSAITLHKGRGMVQKITDLPIRLQSIVYEFILMLDSNKDE